MRNKGISRFFILLIAVILSAGCDRQQPIKIDTSQKADILKQAQDNPEHTLKVCLGGMVTPQEGYVYYKEFLHYISAKIGYELDFIEKNTYAETNNLLETKSVDFAFICGGPYVELKERGLIELLVVPVVYGEPHYYSYIIVNQQSQVYKFEELRGRIFAFSDPLSNSGALVVIYKLAQAGYTPETFFRQHIYTYKHDKSIRAVALGSVDAAAVDSLIWEYQNAQNPVYTAKTRIIEKIGPFGIPPVVIPKGLDPQLAQNLRQALLGAHKDNTGREILKKMHVDKFIPGDDALFDSIRDMYGELKQRRGNK